MPNQLSIIVDYYLEISDKDLEELEKEEKQKAYRRHLRAAKDLLELCDGDTDRACLALDKTKEKISLFNEDWTIDTAVKKFIEIMSKTKERKLLKAPATISKITTMEDRVLRLQVDCQEMVPKEEAMIFEMRGNLGYFLFAPNSKDITKEELDLPEIKVEKGQKTPSQRLRSVLFVAYKKQKRSEDFEVFYRNYMNRVIDSIKEKLKEE